jgi:citrate lyase beta subunit
MSITRSVAVTLDSSRSLLFAPGSDARKLERAFEAGADAVIADLEDAVAPAVKGEARELLRERFASRDGGPRRLVRVNGLGTPFFGEDVALLGELELDGVVLPKATPEGVEALADTGLPVIAIVETVAGVRLSFETASSSGVVALMLGAIDLGTELGLEERVDGQEILYVRSKLALDSAAAGIRAPFDCVHVALRDDDGLAAQCRLARSLGLRGKACIHPAQVPVVNREFSPRREEVEWARGVVAAAEGAEADGRGAVAHEGTLVDLPVVTRALRIVAESEEFETR